MRHVVFVLGGVVLASCVLPLRASAESLLKPGDPIIAIDRDSSASDYPGAESPAKLLDLNSDTKYLNFGKDNSGFIITPAAGALTIQSFQLTTANDALERDPASWALYGFNGSIVSPNNSNGDLESWILLGSGALTLPDTRKTVGPVVSVTNSSSYSSYKLLFPTVKNSAGTNSMQVADVAMFESTDGTGANKLSASDPILGIDADHVYTSGYPANESPAKVIDGVITDSKFLSFGKANSGFIVTPSVGATKVQSFQISTANDWAERDPATFELYGTNDAIASADNSWGIGETRTLIASGALGLPTDRNVLGPIVDVANDTFYTSYKMVFPELRNAGATNSMQIADIQFFGAIVPEPASLTLLLVGGVLATIRRRR